MKLVWVNVRGRARLLRFATLVVISSALAGCIDDFDHPKGYGGNGSGSASGYDCEDLCADSQGCDSEVSASECRSRCTAVERIVRSASCQRVWNETLDCVSGAPKTCNAANDYCASELEDFTACLASYCSSYPEQCNF
jgi:hypothetical protein